MDLTAVLVGNLSVELQVKKPDVRNIRVVCLTMSPYFAQTFNSKIRRNPCTLLQPTSNT